MIIRKTLYACLAWMVVCALSMHVSAQQVVVVPAPGAGLWTVSYTRIFDDSAHSGEFSGSFRTLAAAKEEAVRLQKWSQSMGPTTSWRLKTITIEGEDAQSASPANAAPKTASFFTAVEQKLQADKQVQDSLKTLGIGKTATGEFAANLLTKPDETITKELVITGLNKAISVAEGEAKKQLEQKAADFMGETNAKLTDIKVKFGEYLKNVQSAYKRSEDAKDELLTLTGNLSAQKFKEVNALVDQYNKEAANVPAGLNAIASVVPKMTRVGNETMQQADQLRTSLKMQFELEQSKLQLDSRKESLDQNRSRLESEWNKLQTEIQPFDPQNPKVISLRKRLQEYVAQTEQYNTSLETYKAQVDKLAARIHPSTGTSTNSTGAGSYLLFTGQYSNTADLSGGSSSKFSSLPEAQTAARKHMSTNSSKQPSYRIEDNQGKVIEAQGIYKNVQAKSAGPDAASRNASAAASSSSDTSGIKDCYISWIDEFGAYGGATREEALSSARRLKQLNPQARIRVTVHRAKSTMTIDEIRSTPGKTILELP